MKKNDTLKVKNASLNVVKKCLTLEAGTLDLELKDARAKIVTDEKQLKETRRAFVTAEVAASRSGDHEKKSKEKAKAASGFADKAEAAKVRFFKIYKLYLLLIRSLSTLFFLILGRYGTCCRCD